MNERQRDAIRKFGSNPSWDSLIEEKFRKEFYGHQEPKKKDKPQKEEKGDKSKSY